MVELVVVSKKATRHFAINIDLYNDLSEGQSTAHQLKYIILKMKSQSNRGDSDFKDAENVENINFRLVAYLLTIPGPCLVAFMLILQLQGQYICYCVYEACRRKYAKIIIYF